MTPPVDPNQPSIVDAGPSQNLFFPSDSEASVTSVATTAESPPICVPPLPDSPFVTPRVFSTPCPEVTILYFNDLHNQLTPNDNILGGAARIAGYVAGIREENPNAILLFGGDAFVGDDPSKGSVVMNFLDRLRPDVSVLGNHEFEYGVGITVGDIYGERLDGATQSDSNRLPFVSANVRHNGGQPLASPTRILQLPNGLRIGVIGITTPLARDYEKSIVVEDPVAVAAREAISLRKSGVDLVIALTHVGVRSDLEIAAAAVVDAVIGGHDHIEVQSGENHCHDVRGIPACQVPWKGMYVGRLDLRFNPLRGKWEVASSTRVPMDETIPEDPGVKAWVQKLMEEGRIEAEGDPIFQVPMSLTQSRRAQSDLGRFFGENLLRESGADVVLINSGSFRQDLTEGPHGKGVVAKIFKYENRLLQTRLSGADIRLMLAHSEKNKGGGPYLQYAGPDPSTLRDEEFYTVVVPDFLAKGNDGYGQINGLSAVLSPHAAETIWQPVVIAGAPATFRTYLTALLQREFPSGFAGRRGDATSP